MMAVNRRVGKSTVTPASLRIEVASRSCDARSHSDSGGMKTIYFDYNAFDLTEQAKATMAKNAAWLRSNAAVQVTIEGHCDNRGSTEYNLALGEKRAQVVRNRNDDHCHV